MDYILKELEKTKYAKDVIKHLASLDIKNGSEILAARLAIEIGRYDYAIQISNKLLMKKDFIIN